MVCSHVARLRTWWSGLGLAAGLTLIRARIDDTPLFLAQLERMGIQPRLDEPGPIPGNGVGRRRGWGAVIWVPQLRSAADPRLDHVDSWAQPRLHTLRGSTGQPGPPLDLRDDRLATVRAALSDDPRWRACEGARHHPVLRVDDWHPERGRLESTTASGYGTVTVDERCPCGPSTDQRPDRPQMKGLVSALAPLGLPVATAVVPG
jgi:hypothetical protein